MPRRPTQPLWNVLALDRASGTSLQEQIVAFFRDAVLRGALKPGARLPSSRQLAAELGVARITAVEAFDRLTAEGYFVTRRGVGLFVADTVTDAYLSGLPTRPPRARKGAAPPTAPVTHANHARAPRTNALAPAGSAASRALETSGTDSLPLATGVPALEEFPWKDWARISARVFRERPAAALAYGDPQGLPELRVAIGSLLRLRAEMKVPGRAWLQFQARPHGSGRTLLSQSAYFAPHGLWGFVYWYALYPLHQVIFSGMIRRLAATTTARAHAGEWTAPRDRPGPGVG